MHDTDQLDGAVARELQDELSYYYDLVEVSSLVVTWFVRFAQEPCAFQAEFLVSFHVDSSPRLFFATHPSDAPFVCNVSSVASISLC